jgi:putative hydrolase of HD superfamily
MLTVAIFGYFYSKKVNACEKRVENNFFTALFHDLPEALTRDIISPVKYSVDELSELIAEYEILKIEDDILPNVPENIKDEFKYILGLYNGRKDEFLNKIIIDGEIQVVDDLSLYNQDIYSAIDGLALKQCDKLSAFVEASLSISHGIKSKELVNGKKQILNSLLCVNGVDFKKIAEQIDAKAQTLHASSGASTHGWTPEYFITEQGVLHCAGKSIDLVGKSARDIQNVVRSCYAVFNCGV